MNFLNRLINYFLILSFSVVIAACGDDDDSDPTPTTIVDVAAGNEDFEILVDLLVATGLDSTLGDPNGTFTVFAPTDAAFEALGQDTLIALGNDPDRLTAILQYHVLAAEINASAAVAAAGTTVATVNGKSLAVSLSGTDLLINTATVIDPDNEADNGVIHTIDAVLMPPADMGIPDADIIATATAAGSFTKLLAAVEAAGLTATLEDDTVTFTVFAPTDAAFDAIGEANLTALLGDLDALTAVLTQHLIIGEPAVNSIAAYAANGTSITMENDAGIAVAIVDGSLTIGGATVTMADIYTSNGIIHVIDTVIVGDLELPAPPMSVVEVAAADGRFDTLVQLLENTQLDMVVGDPEGTFTVFAPTDDAFAALGQETLTALANDPDRLADILRYHVIAGSAILADAAIAATGSDMPKQTTANGDDLGLSYADSTLYVNTSTVTRANVMADNGVIHVIDKVMLPPADMETATQTIAEIVQGNGDFSTLLSALQTAGLVGTLQSGESFTVFAPNNAAFAAIPSATLTAILNDPDVLNDLLLQHVVVGAAVDSVTAYTLNGASAITADDVAIPVSIVDGALQVGGATVVAADIYASNGVIHEIDTVIVGDLTLP